MKIDDKTGLVLEGGGMRGVFTAGVLDAFMEAGIRFPYVVGVSAGACNGANYVANQRGRSHSVYIKLIEQYGKDYLGMRVFLRTGNFFNVSLLYDDAPNKLYPFDYDAFFKSPINFEMVTTNLIKGKAEYISNHIRGFLPGVNEATRKLTMDIVLATSSLPYVSHIVNVKGTPMLDGGIVDSIPVERAMAKGFEKNVVILTRNKGYRKPIKRGLIRDSFSAAARFGKYWRYPRFCRALANRGSVYNDQLELVDELEAEGKVIVIRPERPIDVDRVERNSHKLQKLYDEGYEIGKKFCEEHKEDY